MGHHQVVSAALPEEADRLEVQLDVCFVPAIRIVHRHDQKPKMVCCGLRSTDLAGTNVCLDAIRHAFPLEAANLERAFPLLVTHLPQLQVSRTSVLAGQLLRDDRVLVVAVLLPPLVSSTVAVSEKT